PTWTPTFPLPRGASDRAQVLRLPACRATQMNEGARASSGDVLLFLHADVRLGPGALAAVRECMRDADIIGGNFDIRYEGEDWVADRKSTRLKSSHQISS